MTANVYFTKNISPAGLIRAYEALGRPATGATAVKISSGEPGGHYYLDPQLIAPLVQQVHGTIVECNTAYGGPRSRTATHRKVLADHGFTAIAPTDIMDADGELGIPVHGGRHLRQDLVGSHLSNYDFMIDLAHFKGHLMGGFGGVLKNLSIGVASARGKAYIHTAGASGSFLGAAVTDQDAFVESMAEAASAVADRFGERILYIDVMNNLSIDCDCDSHPHPPKIADIGILSSLDPVALDQACVDLVYKAPGREDLVRRIEKQHGTVILQHAEELGMGSRQYQLVSLDE